MISVEEAQALVLSPLSLIGAETLALPQALGRVLAEAVQSRTSHPAADVSAMDGWAVRAQDASPLTRIGESSAGHPFEGTVGPCQTVRIFTGAVMPKGADSVAIQEDCQADGGQITLNAPVQSGQHVRRQGQDFKVGQTMLEPGRVITARDIALLAAMNIPWLSVRRRPRVAVLSTGDELAMPGEPIPAGGLPSSNGLAIAAMVQSWGGEAIDLGLATDDFDKLVDKAKGAEGCDLFVTTGGVSIGAYDKVKESLAHLGFRAGFHKIAMKPGKPLMFGHMVGLPVLGLPGNPVAAMVSAQLFLKPMLRRMLGIDPILPLAVQGILSAPLAKGGARQEYLRAGIEQLGDGRLAAHPFPSQDSAMIFEMARASALILRPPQAPPAQPGESVPLLMLD